MIKKLTDSEMIHLNPMAYREAMCMVREALDEIDEVISNEAGAHYEFTKEGDKLTFSLSCSEPMVWDPTLPGWDCN